MVKESFRDSLHLSAANKQRLGVINEIITQYQRQGYRLTLRQLYYQLVTKNVISNKKTEYAKLSDLLVKGRMAGVVDWEAIVDRVRVPKIPGAWRDGGEILQAVAEQFRVDRMNDQDVYIEVWVEKDALSEVLSRVTTKWHVHLVVNKGYSSCTAMHDAYERMQEAADDDKTPYILYVGDHDPSGLDMVRDIKERLEEFGVDVNVVPIALTSAQVKQYNPPPNPAKFSDPRAKWYVEQFGRTSWEVDALPPEVLHRLVEEGITTRIDRQQFDARLREEDTEKERLRKVADDWNGE